MLVTIEELIELRHFFTECLILARSFVNFGKYVRFKLLMPFLHNIKRRLAHTGLWKGHDDFGQN